MAGRRKGGVGELMSGAECGQGRREKRHERDDVEGLDGNGRGMGLM